MKYSYTSLHILLYSNFVTQVGLPNDELYRRHKLHRGVYANSAESKITENSLFHICDAQYFQTHLPLRPGGGSSYISADFHHVGAIEAFTRFDALLQFSNAQLKPCDGFFYVLHINPDKLSAVEDIVLADDTMLVYDDKAVLHVADDEFIDLRQIGKVNTARRCDLLGAARISCQRESQTGDNEIAAGQHAGLKEISA